MSRSTRLKRCLETTDANVRWHCMSADILDYFSKCMDLPINALETLYSTLH